MQGHHLIISCSVQPWTIDGSQQKKRAKQSFDQVSVPGTMEIGTGISEKWPLLCRKIQYRQVA